IVYGACCIDHDGTGLWTTGLGHGDAMHLSDLDPDRPGLEKWGIHEGSGSPGSALLDARTGEILWQSANSDAGRGVAADLTASYRGAECWGGTNGLRSITNESAGGTPSSTNHVIWWDGDLLRELLDGTSISKYGGDRLLTASGCVSNNGSKSNPCLQVDILGDWREEVIFRTGRSDSLRIYTTTTTTSHRIYTLMHDPQYRLSIAWQNVAYNQPPHTGFYLGDGMNTPPIPDIKYPESDHTPIAWEEVQQHMPKQFVLNDNFPNPFNPITKITFSIAKRGHITLNVYNAIGQLITTLIDKNMAAGTYDVIFNAKELPSGIYLYQIKSDEFMQIKKMLLLK
ncbi:MAG: T9SS type A sorting domain-containing protein, partial [bacterium]